MRRGIDTRIRRLICALTVCVLLAGTCALNVSAADSNPIPEASQGVVQVEAYFSEHYETGSGFAVGIEGRETDIFVTNWHVVADDNGNISNEVYILDRRSDSISMEDYIPCEVLYTTDGYPDLAILRAERKLTGIHALPLLRSESVSAGTRVYALGYPAFTDKISTGASGTDNFTVTSGVVSRFIVMDDWEYTGHTENRKVILHDALIDSGNSGGPLITEDGAVIGINTYGFTNPDTMGTYWAAVYIDYAMDALDKLNLTYSIYGEKTVVKQDIVDSQTIQGLLMGLAGLAVLAVAAVCVILVTKKIRAGGSSRSRSRSRRERKDTRSQRNDWSEDPYDLNSEFGGGLDMDLDMDMDSMSSRRSRRKRSRSR